MSSLGAQTLLKLIVIDVWIVVELLPSCVRGLCDFQ
jgi:hypothetical protein